MGDERRPERLIAAAFVSSAACSAGLTIVYWRGGQPQLEGILLAGTFAGLAVGVTLLAHRLLPGPTVESRHVLDSPASVDRALSDDLGRGGLSRRRLLTRTFALAAGAFGVAALFPLRSLGPRPGRSLLTTPWRRGLRLVVSDGTPVRADDVPVGGLLTAYPDGHVGSADGQVVLVRVDPDLLDPADPRAGWSPEGLLAYSKVCTHAGCPVGLYDAARHELLCPCHQSTFDVLDRARPVFGPAAAPLPQLPLAIDDDGMVAAAGEFSDPVGPSFWHRS
jgi:ubiquinol-cytochrome c reductase iron-sulfur subunit